MGMGSYSCKNCGAPIAFSEGEVSVKCEYCGTVNELTNELARDVQARAAKITIAEVSIKDQADALLKRAYLFLEDRDIYRADEYFDKVLDLCPEEYRAYLGKLMLELSVTQEGKISSRDVNLAQSGNYEKLLRFAPKEKRVIYEGYNRTIQNRLQEHARKEREAERQRERERQERIEENERDKAIYREGIKKAAVFVIVLVALLSGTIVIMHGIVQHNAYKDGIAYAKSGNSEEAIEAFETAGYGYKDVKEKIRKPAYEQAEKLFKDGSYLKAASYYIKADGYQDSAQKLRAISKAVSPIFGIGEGLIAYTRKDGSFFIPYHGKLGEYDELSDSKVKELESLYDVVWMHVSRDYGDVFEIFLALKKDGTVICNGSFLEDYEPYKEVALWKDISKICYTSDAIIGLKSNGDLVSVREENDSYGPPDWKDIEDIKISAWNKSALGLKKDGTVVFDGYNSSRGGNFSSWKNIKAIAFQGHHCVGLKNDGTVVAAGDNYDKQCDVSSWTDIIEIMVDGWHTLGLKNDGTVSLAGQNDEGERDVSSWRDIISLQLGEDGIYGLKSNGTVVYAGPIEEIRDEVSTWKNVVYIQFDEGGLYALQSDGTLLTTDDRLPNSVNLNLSDIFIAPIN